MTQRPRSRLRSKSATISVGFDSPVREGFLSNPDLLKEHRISQNGCCKIPAVDTPTLCRRFIAAGVAKRAQEPRRPRQASSWSGLLHPGSSSDAPIPQRR
jgi:hypothetical protein